MATLSHCPACTQPDTLITLGVRYERPHRWRPWVTTLTQLYLCAHCEALVAIGHRRDPIVESGPGYTRHTVARAEVQEGLITSVGRAA